MPSTAATWYDFARKSSLNNNNQNNNNKKKNYSQSNIRNINYDLTTPVRIVGDIGTNQNNTSSLSTPTSQQPLQTPINNNNNTANNNHLIDSNNSSNIYNNNNNNNNTINNNQFANDITPVPVSYLNHPKRIVIDSILIALVGPTSEATKLNMLVFLQEQCLDYFDDIKILWCFFNTMKHVLEQKEKRGTITAVLKGQVLVVATTILIHIDAIDEYRTVFNNFIVLLATVIQKTNSFSDCYARQMACESLRELEMTYPCLLAGFVEDILEDKELFDQSMALPSLFKLCHAERSHTGQSYTVLLLSILEHCATHKFNQVLQTKILQETKQEINSNDNQKNIDNNNNSSEKEKVKLNVTSSATADTDNNKNISTATPNNNNNNTSWQSDAYTPTPSPGRFNWNNNSSSKRFSSTKFSSARKAMTVQSLPTPLTARLSRVPVPLLRSGIGDLLLDMGKEYSSSLSVGQLSQFQVPESTVGHNGPMWCDFYSHYPKTMLAPNNVNNSSSKNDDKRISSPLTIHGTGGDDNDTEIQLFNDFVINKLVSVFSFVLKDAWELMSPWSLTCMVAKIVPFAHMLHLDPSLFRHHFLGLAFTRNPLLFHMVLLLHSAISGVFSEEDELILVRRLKVLMNDSSTLIHTRLLAVHWLLCFPAQTKPPNGFNQFTPLFLLLHNHNKDLWPTIFDPLILREAKLQALLHCFDTTPFSKCGPPTDIIDALVSLGEYRYYGPFSRVSAAVYRFLYQLLQRFPNRVKDVQRVLLDTIVQCPRFVENTIHLIDLYMSKNKTYLETKCLPVRNALLATLAVTANLTLGKDNNNGLEEEKMVDNTSYRNSALFLLASFCPMLTTVEPARRLHHYFALMERIVSETEINPLPILTAILRYMRITDVCYQGDWSTGTKILSICRSSLITHPTELVYEALGDVLRFMAKYYGDVDTRDRAWLYLQLLTHVERQKLLTILCGTNENENLVIDFKPKQHRSVVTLPIEKFLTLDPSVEKRRALGLQDEGTADIVHMLWKGGNDGNDGKNADNAKLFEKVLPLDILAHYLLFMNDHKEQFEIHMPLQIRYRENIMDEDGDNEENKLSASSMKDPIYALVLEFSRSPDYVPIESINLPYLKNFVENEDQSKNEKSVKKSDCFPFMYKLVLTLRPIAPVPTFFNVRLVFNDTKGGMFEGSLQDVKVLFQDLFLPLPLKLVFSNELQTGGKKAVAYLQNILFMLLWDAVMLPNMGFRNIEKLKAIQCDGAESVKHLQMPKERVIAAVKDNLGPFMIVKDTSNLNNDIDDPSEFEDAEENWYTQFADDKDDRKETHNDHNHDHHNDAEDAKVSDMIRLRAIVVLPPKYHLLFKFHISKTSTVIRIRTDRWQLLSELDGFFQNW